MNYNVWYKAPAGIWVNGSSHPNKKEADQEAKCLKREGKKEIKVIPSHESI